MFKITIITPTIGSRFFRNLLISLNRACIRYTNTKPLEIEHFVVVDDAPTNAWKIERMLLDVVAEPGITRYVFKMPFSTGGDGYKGHKIYAGISQFVRGDWVMFLDDDNEVEEDIFLQYIKKVVERGAAWGYCLRSIIGENSEVLMLDSCESLGHLMPVYYNLSNHLIDTNCYIIKSSILKQISPVWNRPAQYDVTDPDRVFGNLLMEKYENFRCIKKPLIRYRCLEGESKIGLDLWKAGNKLGYENLLKLPEVYIAHFNEDMTNKVIERLYSRGSLDDLEDVTFKQWQLNLWDGMRDLFFFKSAYNSKYIPSESVVVCHMCHSRELPLKVLKRNDIYKVLYTIESPNIRHQEQWDIGFLQSHFNCVITYWDELYRAIRMKGSMDCRYYPFIHRMGVQDLTGPRRPNMLLSMNDKERSCGIVLERRNYHQAYQINGCRLMAQDYKRAAAVRTISERIPVVCYGESWRGMEGRRIQVVDDIPSRFDDNDRVIDYYGRHQFVIVIENCNAEGYVSEKIYDVWMAGSIPIYEGNFSNRLMEFFEGIPVMDMFIPFDNLDMLNDDQAINRIKGLISTHREDILWCMSVTRYGRMLGDLVLDLTRVYLD